MPKLHSGNKIKEERWRKINVSWASFITRSYETGMWAEKLKTLYVNYVMKQGGRNICLREISPTHLQ